MAEHKGDSIKITHLSPISLGTGRGATFTAVETHRKMKLYGVLEPELDQLGMLHSFSILFLSIGSALAGYSFDFLREWYMNPAPPPGTWMVFSSFGFLSLLCFGVGLFLMRKKRSLVQTIKEQAAG